MTTKFVDFNEHIIQYENNNVYLAMSTNTIEPFFHKEQLSRMLEYDDRDNEIKILDNSDVFKLEDIVINYKRIFNMSGKTKFVNKKGMYELIANSKSEHIIEIKELINNKIIPEIQKYSEYKMQHPLKKQINETKLKINEFESKINKLNDSNLDIIKKMLVNILDSNKCNNINETKDDPNSDLESDDESNMKIEEEIIQQTEEKNKDFVYSILQLLYKIKYLEIKFDLIQYL